MAFTPWAHPASVPPPSYHRTAVTALHLDMPQPVITSSACWAAPSSLERSRRCASTVCPPFDVDPPNQQPQGEYHLYPAGKHDSVHVEVREKQ